MAKKLPKSAPRLPSTDPRAEAFVTGGKAPEAPHTPAAGSLTASLLDAPPAPVTIGAFYRLWPAQVEWLATVAHQRKQARGGRGRSDASEVLRLVLDKAIEEWKAEQGEKAS